MGRPAKLHTTLTAYKIRITPLGNEIPPDPWRHNIPTEGMLAFEKEKLVNFVRSFEISKKEGKPHWHYYALSYCRKSDLDARMNKIIGPGNGFHASACIVEEYPALPLEYMSYILKECIDPTFVGFSQEEEDACWAVANETAERLQAYKKRRSGMNTLEKIEENILNRLKDTWKEENPKIPNHEETLMRLIILAYLDLNMLPQPHIMKAYCRTILLKNYPDDHLNKYAKFLAQSVWE